MRLGLVLPCETPRQRNEFGTHIRLTIRWFRQTKMAEGCRSIIGVMTDVTQIWSRIEAGDPAAPEQLLPCLSISLFKKRPVGCRWDRRSIHSAQVEYSVTSA